MLHSFMMFHDGEPSHGMALTVASSVRSVFFWFHPIALFMSGTSEIGNKVDWLHLLGCIIWNCPVTASVKNLETDASCALRPARLSTMTILNLGPAIQIRACDDCHSLPMPAL